MLQVSVREGEDEAEGEEGGDDDDGESEIEIHPRDRLQERSILASLDDLSQEKEGLIRQAQGPVDNGPVPREDTARQRKWFSMPAVALQTMPVFTRVWQRGIRKGKGRSKVLQ